MASLPIRRAVSSHDRRWKKRKRMTRIMRGVSVFIHSSTLTFSLSALSRLSSRILRSAASRFLCSDGESAVPCMLNPRAW